MTAITIDHHARSLTTFPLHSSRIPEQIPQKRVNQRGVVGLPLHRTLSVNPHHRRGHLARSIGDETMAGNVLSQNSIHVEQQDEAEHIHAKTRSPTERNGRR